MTKKILAAVFLVTVCISGNKTLQAQDAVVQVAKGESGKLAKGAVEKEKL